LLSHVRPKRLVALVILLGGPALAVLLSGPLGARLFGHMDGVWCETARLTNDYVFFTEWPPSRWLEFVAALGISLEACRYLAPDPPVRRLVLMVIGVALLGIAGSALAELMSYALPLQAQPFRLLWLIQLLQVPLGLLLISHWWSLGSLLSRGSA